MVSKRKNKKKVQGLHQRIDIRGSIIRKLIKQWGGATETRASEAKGHFPGGKRVGSRGRKNKRESINNENKKARGLKSTGFNETKNRIKLISK
jgi:hypothetical protein